MATYLKHFEPSKPGRSQVCFAVEPENMLRSQVLEPFNRHFNELMLVNSCYCFAASHCFCCLFYRPLKENKAIHARPYESCYPRPLVQRQQLQ